ncbi:MAG TPA: AAA family ATPase, partial [Acidimicrobiales bacterium]|nr:AAA family ATPase [Acidimicrobiales bacterium]
IGVSCGEATREGDDYFGDPVVEAKRLCDRAGGGQILVSQVARVVAGRRTSATFSLLGALELKGIPAPVQALETNWDPLPGPGTETVEIPFPERLAVGPEIGVIGREAEDALLDDAFKRVVAGEGSEVVMISGEPGVGKTTLASQLARRAFAAGASVLLGRCDEDLGIPHGPFVEALRHYVDHAPEDFLRAHVQDFGAELETMVPTLSRRVQDLPPPMSADPATERYLLYRAVVGLLDQASFATPVVLVLDDLQWADAPSLQLLRHLVDRSELHRLLIVGAFRSAEMTTNDSLTETLVVLRRERQVIFLELKGLDESGVMAFVEAAAGHELSQQGMALARALYRETDGNPFFVGEILRHLSETGAIYRTESGRWTASDDLGGFRLPDSLVQLVNARVSRLGAVAKRVLPVAAAIGGEFELKLLSTATDTSDDEILGVLAAATRVSLVEEMSGPPGRFGFAHSLIQHTLYQNLGPTQQARAHRRIAEAMETTRTPDRSSRAGSLAYHWARAAEPDSLPKAASYERQAGDDALSALAPDEAVRHFAQAFDFQSQQAQPDPLAETDILIDLGTAQFQAGIPAFRESFLSAAHRAMNLRATDRLIRAALGNNRGVMSAAGEVDFERVEVLEAALSSLPKADSRERALILATLCAELTYGSFEQRKTLADDARSMARRIGDPGTLVQVLNLVSYPLSLPWLLDERLRDGTEALVLAESFGDPVQLMLSAAFAAHNAMQAGDFHKWNECLEMMRDLSKRISQPTLMYYLALTEAANAVAQGDPQRAERHATELLEIGSDSGQPEAMSIYGFYLYVIRRQQGRSAELLPVIEQVAADNPGIPAYKTSIASIRLHDGDESYAKYLLDSESPGGFASVPKDISWLATLTVYADLAAELEVVEHAESLFRLLAPFAEQIAYPGAVVLDPVSLSLGRLASVLRRYDDAEAYLSEAFELSDRGGMRYVAARTQLAFGKMLVNRRSPGDLDRARVFLENAHAASVSNAYYGVERSSDEAIANLD